MDKEQQKRINKNNRHRGSKMEKVVADFLDMDVVPYSGSNARYGYGDVRDTVWLGECKNISPIDNIITIKYDWLSKLLERATSYNKMPFLAFMPRASANKYILLSRNTWEQVNKLICEHGDFDVNDPNRNYRYVTHILKLDLIGNAINVKLHMDDMKLLGRKCGVMHTIVSKGERIINECFIMHIGVFHMFRERIPSLKGGRQVI